jgi:predicted protein tyrosine phosphatase
MRKALFVCSANLDRSPTAEGLFSHWKGVWETRSAGIAPSLGRNALSQDVIDWADVILAMEPLHAEYLFKHFKCKSNKLHVLNISNRYARDDPELIQELQLKAAPILDREDIGMKPISGGYGTQETIDPDEAFERRLKVIEERLGISPSAHKSESPGYASALLKFNEREQKRLRHVNRNRPPKQLSNDERARQRRAKRRRPTN